MKITPLFYRIAVCIGSIFFITYSADSLSNISEKKLITPPPNVSLTGTDSTFKPDKFSSFSVLQKKQLRTVVITNLLYACGFGLYRGVVIPRYRDAADFSEQMRVIPMSLLSNAMIYVSLPMSMVASRKAKNNYEHYYKEAPRNLTMPLLFIGVGCLLGATAVDYFQLAKDYQDNNELDNSYKKYDDLVYGILDAGTICWAGTNLYALIYTIVLQRKAKNNAALSSLQITPFRIQHANGLAVTFEY